MVENYSKVCNYFHQHSSSVFHEDWSSHFSGVLNFHQIIFVCQFIEARVTKLMAGTKIIDKVKIQNTFGTGQHGQYNGKVSPEISIEQLVDNVKRLDDRFIMEELFLKKELGWSDEEIKSANLFQLFQTFFPHDSRCIKQDNNKNQPAQQINRNSQPAQQWSWKQVWEKLSNIEQLLPSYIECYGVKEKCRAKRFEICALNYLRRRLLNISYSGIFGDVKDHILTMMNDGGKIYQSLTTGSKQELLHLTIDHAQKIGAPSGLFYDQPLPDEFYQLFVDKSELMEKDKPFYNILVKRKWSNIDLVTEKVLTVRYNYEYVGGFKKLIYNLIVIGGQNLVNEFRSFNICAILKPEDLDKALAKHQEVRKEFIDFLFETFSSLYSSRDSSHYLTRDLCGIIETF